MVIIYVLCVILLAISFGILTVRLLGQAPRQFMSWSEVVEQLQPVDLAGIRAVALDLLETESIPRVRNDDELWVLLGGAKGLLRMKDNSDLFLRLAQHAEKWSPRESKITFERMRDDALTLNRALRAVAFAKTIGFRRRRLPLYVHDAAESYYLMGKRLLALYEASHSALYPALNRHLGGGYSAQ